MPCNKCVVPHCPSRKPGEERSFFTVPVGSCERSEWEKAIPGLEALKAGQRVCERHFDEGLIIRKFIARDVNGDILAQSMYSRPRLRKGAVPNIFSDDTSLRERSPLQSILNTINRNIDHSYSKNKSSPKKSSRRNLELFYDVEEVELSKGKSSSTAQTLTRSDKDENRISEDCSIVRDHGLDSLRTGIIKISTDYSLEHSYASSRSDEEKIFESEFTSSKNLANNEVEYDNQDITGFCYSCSLVDASEAEKQEIDYSIVHSPECDFRYTQVESEEIVTTCQESNAIENACGFACDGTHQTQNIQVEDGISQDSSMKFGVTPDGVSEPSHNISDEEKAEDVSKDSPLNGARIQVTFNYASEAVTHHFEKKPSDLLDEMRFLLPKPWTVCKVGAEKVAFTYLVENIRDGVTRHVIEKSVIINASRDMTYEVYSSPINTTGTTLPQKLDDMSQIVEILKKFKDMRMCQGVASSGSKKLWRNDLAKNGVTDEWRHAQCSGISLQSIRCQKCKKLSKSLAQKSKTTKKKRSRISTKDSLIYQKALKNKLKSQQRKNKVLQKQLASLKEALAKYQEGVAGVSPETLTGVKGNHRVVLEEIIKAAKVKDPRGRRYTDEFIMLCMLLNIRSKSTYEWLKRDILPLPCTNTIRDYLSMVNRKCGFDEDFFKILEKTFKLKSPFNRHGIITLDEITLRKSVAVSTKDLTYTGLADFGDERSKSTSIDEKASQGLVIQFQSITDNYTQPIAVFASKNPVPGDELAKIVVRAICLLENAGAMVHGIVGDGARTNKKMWSILGIDSSIEKLKSWFTHPLHDDRKIFMFSDTPHLMKTVRNRIYDKKILKVDPNADPIKWEYFTHLFQIDSKLRAHARVCPKISLRHIQLDNTAKMRVKLATQILSKSCHDGLLFYLAHHYQQFAGCEATADFCLRMNQLFDALNRKQPNEGLTPESPDYKILEETLEWLNEWERKVQKVNKTKIDPTKIHPDLFLTMDTAQGLRVTIRSTLDLCKYLIDNYNFQ